MDLGLVTIRDSHLSEFRYKKISGGILGRRRSARFGMARDWSAASFEALTLGAVRTGQWALSQRGAACVAGRLPLT